MEEMIADCTEMTNGMSGMMGGSMMRGGMMSGMMDGMMDGGMMDGGMMMPLWIFASLVVIGIIAAAVLAASAARRAAVPAPQRAETPLAILRRRYAAGEIDAEQFQKMKVELGES